MKPSPSIDALLNQATASGSIPGVVAAATDGKRLLYSGAAGHRGLDNAAPMSLDTTFWIASMTKAIVGAACMQLVESGRLDLDSDAGLLVPALAMPRVLEGFAADGSPRLRPARGTITLRRLLTHTAGFAYDMWNPKMNQWTLHSGLPRVATFQRPEDCLPLDFDPGTSWAYGVGIDWAGKLLEAVTGDSLDSYLQKNIFAPLGMTSTGYRLRPEISARFASMHQRHPDGRLEPIAYAAPQEPEAFLGGGGLYSTVGDYLRFIMMILGEGALEGTRLLKPQTIAIMAENHIGDLDVLPLRTAQPAMTNDADFFPGMKQKWGLTFLINTADVAGRRRAGSLCWAGLRNTYFWIDRRSGLGGAVMTQILPFADPTVLRLFESFEREIYKAYG